jgi:predicted ABC-type ATPase
MAHDVNSSSEPLTVYVVAGPNGAGKTTFAMEFLPGFVRCREFLNADLIAAQSQRATMRSLGGVAQFAFVCYITRFRVTMLVIQR